ncbi:MAG: porin family protein [Tannerellaceae bacterium]|jgi:outer membrane protein|nr:porin family protein [Tannerellaceae bacterium]
MKKAVSVIVFAVIMAVSAQAQVFIGGSLGADYGGGKTKSGSSSTDRPSTFSIEFSPRVGYYLNDRFAAGIDVGFKRMVHNDRADTETKNFTTAFGVGAFGRYHAVEVDRLALILEGELGWGTGMQKTKTGSNSTEGDPVNTLGLFVYPVLSYSLTERLSLEAYSDFLRLGLGMMTTENDEMDRKTTKNYFGFGVNAEDNELYREASGSAFSIGIVFKF